jgi:hypothetical protein
MFQFAKSSFLAGLIIVLLAFTFATSAAYAQDETVTIKKSELTPQQQKQVESEQLTDRLKKYGFAAGIGHEIGTAVNESLQAVTQNAAAFADTKVGKVTMAVVVWKVVGKEITGLLLGIAMFAVGIPIWVWSYRRFLPRKYLVKEFKSADGTTTKEYDYGYGGTTKSYGSDNRDVAVGWQIGHWVILLIFTWITLAGVIF